MSFDSSEGKDMSILIQFYNAVEFYWKITSSFFGEKLLSPVKRFAESLLGC